MTHAFATHSLAPLPELSARHQASIAASLAYRLEKAKKARNSQLVALLEQEQRQLETQQREAQAGVGLTLTAWSQNLQRAIAKFAQPSAISVERIVDGSSVFWRAHDPATGDTYCAETESEIIDWVEARPYRRAKGMSGLWGWHGTFLRQTLDEQAL